VNVSVRAVALNPADYKLRNIPIVGSKFEGKPVGLDVSGVVTSSGDPNFKEGDEVYGTCSGSLAQLVTVEATRISLKPTNVSFVEAASLATVSVTGLQAIRDHGKFPQGGSVLVIGASGGCGFVAIQIAKALGASRVVGVCSSKNSAWVKTLGADDVHEYDTTGKKLPTSEKFDVVYDTVSSPDDFNFETEGINLVKENGKYVALNGGGLKWTSYFLQKTFGVTPGKSVLLITQMNTTDLLTIKEMVEKINLKPQLMKNLVLKKSKSKKHLKS